MTISLSVLVLTKNEEKTLPGCLESLQWADEIVVLDSLSSDRTVEIARDYGCRVFSRAFDDWSSHQNWALKNLPFENSWVFNVDADEHIPGDLAEEILEAVRNPGEMSAFAMRRKDYLGGVWLKHSTLYPTWLVRLYKRHCVRFKRLVNPVTVVEGGTGFLKSHIIHYPFSKGVRHWITRHNSYSTFEASEYLKGEPVALYAIFNSDPNQRRRAMKYLFSRMPLRPVVKFLHLYFARRGFLDGRPGLDYAMLQAIYEYFIALKIREMRRVPEDRATYAAKERIRA